MFDKEMKEAILVMLIAVLAQPFLYFGKYLFEEKQIYPRQRQYECENLVVRGDSVSFVHSNHIFSEFDFNELSVKKKDGMLIRYRDDASNSWPFKKLDLKLNRVIIEKSGECRPSFYYQDDPLGKLVVEKAQIQFDTYLAKILEAKKQEERQREDRLKCNLEKALRDLD